MRQAERQILVVAVAVVAVRVLAPEHQGEVAVQAWLSLDTKGISVEPAGQLHRLVVTPTIRLLPLAISLLHRITAWRILQRLLTGLWNK